ncbi:(2Fe-2S)-binding protein [Arsenicicoccus sp. oral taxon 190]|uniref:(2Fe-2S)-binding protein n=1 Tax=Arsenicicoccus sp. oral taxon 190 TaxID=1658671 RepID=UPI0009E3AB39|nr:(2Fe-2S)-binding protein [Arsenicicoccus sp. oral taxon 190]
MIVCHCRVVRDTDIDAVVAAGARTLGAVCQQSGAGTVCGGCVPAVRSLLHRYRETRLDPTALELTLGSQLARVSALSTALEDSHAAA